MSFQFINFSFFSLFYSTKQKKIISLIFFSPQISPQLDTRKENIFSPLFLLSHFLSLHFLSFLFSFTSKQSLRKILGLKIYLTYEFQINCFINIYLAALTRNPYNICTIRTKSMCVRTRLKTISSVLNAKEFNV